jgi:lipopolysaccharide transport system permease protein
MITVDANRRPFAASLAEYRSYGTLFFFLTIRDLKLRYRQTALGIAWAIVQPLLPMLIFAAIFSHVLRTETGAIPYPIFVLSGLAPWSFFANAVTTSSHAFVNNYNLLNKVYFPRAILPIASVAACIFDWVISTLFVIVIMLWQGFRPIPAWLLLPAVIGAGLALAMAVALASSSLIVVYRDLKHLFPFLVQIWMYATPVIYPATLIPKSVRWAAGLNPMTGIVEAFRWCLFGGACDWQLLGLSCLSTMLCIAFALVVFQHLESDLAERA